MPVAKGVELVPIGCVDEDLFASVFLRVWKSLPVSDREVILNYHNSITVEVRPVAGAAGTATAMYGSVAIDDRFFGSYPIYDVCYICAHELGHLYDYAQAGIGWRTPLEDLARFQDDKAAREEAADAAAERWGFPRFGTAAMNRVD